jgi:uncharacterized protein YegL
MTSLPGGQMSGRPLHFIWIADCSGSMSGDKIQSLNDAIRQAIPEMRNVAHANPHANVLVRAIKFSNGATWHVTQPTPIEQFTWTNLTAGGVTDMGRALKMVANELKVGTMSPRGLPPVLVLITDGHPTDDVAGGINAIMNEPWGQKAVRIAIGIGSDVNYNVLQRFIGHQEIQPLQANNADQLVNYIKWASTAVLQSSSAPNIHNDQTVPNGTATTSNPYGATIPAPPSSGNSSADIW